MALSFTLTDSYPDKVIEKSGRAIVGRSGNRMLYSIDALSASRGWSDAALFVKRSTVDKMLVTPELPYRERLKAAESTASEILQQVDPQHSTDEIVPYVVSHEVAGYGPFSVLMEDESNIEEIVVNSPRSEIGIYHTRYGYCTTNLRFTSEDSFRHVINRLILSSNKELNSSNPIVDTYIHDGSRIHAQIYPYSRSGCSASIRLKGGKSTDIRKLVCLGSSSPEVLAYLWLAMDSQCNLVISGAPASGKTTTMLALCSFMPRVQRIITVEEDMSELDLHSGFMNSVNLKGSNIFNHASVKEQVVNALHMRPDRLLIGEVRSDETREVFFGANVGVPFMTTMHSSSDGIGVISRLQARPMSVEQSTLSMLDLSIFMRQADSGRRVIDSITEYKWLSRNETDMNASDLRELEMLNLVSNSTLDMRRLSDSKIMLKYARIRMMSVPSAIKELKMRAAFLEKIAVEDPKRPILDCMESYGV
jgi:type IV secretory pathway ATPase VirB11/archaellum biosynthesis ATPase